MLQLFVSLFYICFLALMKKIILCLLPIIAFTLPQDNIVYEVIVIGAGLAGIGASKVLTDNQIPHLMIEGRNRIGGRVTDIEFQGATIQLGGLLLHSPNKQHPILQIMRQQLNWSTIHGGYSTQEGYYYQNQGQIQEQYINQMQNLEKEIILEMLARSKLAPKDMSVQQAARYYFQGRLKDKVQIVKDLVYWLVEEYGNIEGSDLWRLSARMIQFDETPDDLLPEGGYAQLVRGIFNKCKPDLRLNETVLSIDYSQDIVKIETNKGAHYAKKIISSLPLGVLQHKQVQLIPEIPREYQKSINLLDASVHQKVIVSFSQPFWNPEHIWLSLVRRNMTKSMYQMAHVVHSKTNKNVLMLFISGDDGRTLLEFTDQELRQNLTEFFNMFSKKPVVIEQIYRTNWLEDEFTRGAYTSFPVGASRQCINIFSKPIENKIWMVGQHTHPKLKSLTHGAFLTGKKAAETVAFLIKNDH